MGAESVEVFGCLFSLRKPKVGKGGALGSPLQGRSMINAGALRYCG